MAGDRDPKHSAGDQSVHQVAGNLRATRHPVVRTRSPKGNAQAEPGGQEADRKSAIPPKRNAQAEPGGQEADS